MNDKIQSSLNALKFIIPFLEKKKFSWLITGGFAAYIYGVKRDLTDIDIDIETEASTPLFQEFLKEIKLYIIQDLEHYIDKNYDNYNVELIYEGQLIDICPSKNLKIFDKSKNGYRHFYEEGFPNPTMKEFKGLLLPLLPKDIIIKNKEMLVSQRETDIKDIESLKKLK